MRIRFEQRLAAPQHIVAAFFFNAANLRRVVPPFPRLTIETANPSVIQGARFPTTISFGFCSFHWVVAIESAEPCIGFMDSFSGGPFRSWRHHHSFVAVADGTIVVDDIDAEPVWWFRPFAHTFVATLFAFRRPALRRVFESSPDGRG